jgi:hypothetical protein
MSEMVGQRVDYQLMLRGTGAYLDRYRASSIAVIEMPDGFALRYQEDGKGWRSVRLIYEDLEALQTDMEWRRDPRQRSDGQLTEEYQNLLRALGWELRRQSAKSILVEELDDRLLVTYLGLHPQGHNIWVKHMFFLGAAERETMLRAAGQRRTLGPPRGPILPRGAATDGQRGSLAPEDYWEMGEREQYRTELKNAWTGPRQDHGKAELVLTNRRILLRFGDGTDRTLLARVGKVSPEARRDLFSRIYKVEIHREGRDRLSLDCWDQAHMNEVAGRIEQVRLKVKR